MALLDVLEEWRFTMMEDGERSVMTSGMKQMQMWFVSSWIVVLL